GFVVEIGGTAPGNAATDHDQLNVTGTVSLGNALLTPLAFNGFVPAGGQSFVIINNDSTDAISGIFNGLAEGATIPNFLGSGLNATITYTGGTNNNDVVLTTIVPCPTLTVNDSGDEPDAILDGVCETATGNGFCTLRAAIMESNAATSCPPLTINFTLLPGSEPQLIILGSALPAITRSVTIQGPVGQMVSVDGGDSYRVFAISTATTVNISNLIIQHASEANDGAGLLNSGSATVNLSNCVFTDNGTDDANGAAIANAAGTLNIWNSTFANNQTTSSGNGGAIYNDTGIVNLTNNTISGNGADTNAGGVYNNAGTVNVRNTIIAG